MFDLVLQTPSLPAMSDTAIEAVRELAGREMELPQVPLPTEHVLHGGLYCRTICMPAGTRVVGALIKIPTTVIVHGICTVWIGEESWYLSGYNVLQASAGRKQVFEASEETFITMLFPTAAKTTEEAEREFTDEFELLASRRADTPNQIVITGE